MFKRILIANRGEIACRIIKTARRMGIETVAVYSDADRDALHVEMADEAVHIGPPPAAESYLVIDKIVAACKADRRRGGASGLRLPVRARGVRRRRSQAAGIVFIGPNPEAIAAMGDKIESKKAAAAAKVSTVPGYLGVIADAEQAAKIADEIGYPVMIKASAGGGGKGMRIAHSRAEVAEGFARAIGSEVLVRRRPRVHRKIHRRSAPHRNPGARRQARQRHLSRRARMLDPAPQPEGHRGSAVAAARRGDAQEDGRAGGRAGQGGRLRQRRHGRVRRGPGQELLFPRNEYAAAGRASGDRTGHRHRSRRADDPRRRRREALDQAERREAERLGGRKPHLCRRSVSRLPAVDRPAHALSAAGGNARRAASRCATTPASTKAARFRSSTIR